MHRFKFLITGMGHSGTGCVSQALTSVGIPCTHEGVRRGEFVEPHGAGGYPLEAIEADSNCYMSMPGNFELPFFERATIIHLVRDPIKVIRSCCDKQYRLGKKVDVLAWVREWIDRNLYVEARHVPRPYHMFRIEDGPARLMEIVGKPGVEPHWDPIYNKHNQGNVKLSWQVLPLSDEVYRLRAMATRYGYLCTF